MEFGGKPFRVSLSEAALLQEEDDWTSDQVKQPGWHRDVPATFQVTVAWADAPAGAASSVTKKLHFTVDAAREDDPDDPADLPTVAKTTSRVGAARVVRVVRRYDGPALNPGSYSLRYRCRDDQGLESEAFDHTVQITG
jgi:hypothetical protein